jgi:hypothetical protein
VAVVVLQLQRVVQLQDDCAGADLLKKNEKHQVHNYSLQAHLCTR